MYFLERKTYYNMPFIIGNTSMPLPTWRWKTIYVCETKEPLQDILNTLSQENYRIISNQGVQS
jgi:hypothetical protein